MLLDRAARMLPRGSLFLLAVTSFGMHAPPIGLHRACDCDAHLGQLTGEERARVEPVHIEIISLVVERLHQCLNHPNCVRMIIVDELSLPAIVHTHPLKVSRLTVG